MKRSLILYIIAIAFGFGCDNTIDCQRHYLPKNYTGDVMVYLEQKNGHKNTDKDGCEIYQITTDGKCISGFRLEEGTAVPDVTIKYFEPNDKNQLLELPEFEATEYYADSLKNQNRKYVYFLASGRRYSDLFVEYYVDYGYNHKKYDNR